MKRTIAAVLMLCLLCSFASCAGDAPEPTAPAGTSEPTQPSTLPTEATPPSTVPSAPIAQEPMFSICVPVVTEYAYAQNGAVIYSHTYQDISLILPDPEVAKSVIIDFLNRVDSAASGAEAILTAAQADYSGSEDWIPYSCYTVLSPQRIDQHILSLYGINSTYSGAAHPAHASLSANYDMITGQALVLSDILAGESAMEGLCQLLIEALEETKSQITLYPNYDSTIRQLFSAEPEHLENWYFSQAGLCFYFSPYEIGPYASGIIEAQIPYAKLTGIISDACFPPEQICEGQIICSAFDTAQIGNITQICEVTTDPGGEKVLLHSGDTSVSDIRLEFGTWDSEGVAFTPVATILACATLTPGDAILVETYIPDVMPNLRLTYLSGEENVTQFIFQSGKDGTVYLTE